MKKSPTKTQTTKSKPTQPIDHREDVTVFAPNLTISNLISHLEALKNQYGDLEVMTTDNVQIMVAVVQSICADSCVFIDSESNKGAW